MLKAHVKRVVVLKLAGLTAVLDSNTEQDQVTKLHRVDRHEASFSEITPPVLVRVLVVNPVLQVVR